jgi:hypothetical protein
VDNGGVFIHKADAKETPSDTQIAGLIQKYRGLSDMYIIRFNKWICNNVINEYRYSTEQDVNPIKTIRTITGWHI